MANPKIDKAGAHQGSGAPEVPSKTVPADVGQQALGEAYLAYVRYAEMVDRGQVAVKQLQVEAYQRYVDSLRAVGQDAQERYAAALKNLEENVIDAQSRAAEVQQGLAQTPSTALGESQQDHVGALQEIQRRQVEAYQAFSAELASLLQQDLPRRAQEVFGEYSAALAAAAAEARQLGQDASRDYLTSVKDFWTRLDVDAAAATLSAPIA